MRAARDRLFTLQQEPNERDVARNMGVTPMPTRRKKR
nr:MAG TPA: hypothetical protein [Caudoviricetes sp.]